MMPMRQLAQNDKDNNKKNNKQKSKEKHRSEICRYLWFNEYYADRQNRLQKERLQVYLKHLQKEKVNMLVNFYRETEEIMYEHKRCLTSTGLIRENYQSILKSRNDSALNTYLQYYSVGADTPTKGISRDQLREKFNNNVKMHKFKPPVEKKLDAVKVNETSKSKSLLKTICSDEDDIEQEIDSVEDDDEFLDKESEMDYCDRKVLNYDDKKELGRNARRSISGPLSKHANLIKSVYETRRAVKSAKTPKSAPVNPRPSIDMSRLYDPKTAKKRIAELMSKRLSSEPDKTPSTLSSTPKTPVDPKKRAQSVTSAKPLPANTNPRNTIPNSDFVFTKFPNELLEYQYLSALEMKERLIASKPDKQIIKIKMNRDPVFAKRYKQFNSVKNCGRSAEYDVKDSHIAPIKMTNKQIEKEREKIVEKFGKKYEHYHTAAKTDENLLKQKIDAFLQKIKTK